MKNRRPTRPCNKARKMRNHMKYTPTTVRRGLGTLGEHVSVQRRLLGLTTEDLAKRAGVSADVVRSLEHGRPIRTDGLLSVLNILQLLGPALDATDPYRTDLGVARSAEILPRRIRHPKPSPPTPPPSADSGDTSQNALR